MFVISLQLIFFLLINLVIVVMEQLTIMTMCVLLTHLGLEKEN